MERKGYTLKSLALLVALGAMVFCASFICDSSSSRHLFVRSAIAQSVEDDSNTVIVSSGFEEVEGQREIDAKEDVQPDEAEVSIKEHILGKIKKNWNRSIDKMPSLFFTYWQHQSIIDAKNSHGKVRPPTEAELKALTNESNVKPDPERRYVSLGGIVYKAENDWTIWLNGQRVTPDAVPKEVMDLRVFEDYIEVKWLDEYTNSIFPLRLRAHQRFNMDMRIFLPG